MQKLNLPQFDIPIRKNDIATEVFDPVRRRWVLCTAEEWVRQNILLYLVCHLNYPIGLISVEYSFELSYGKRYRADIVVFNKNIEPLLLIECKAPDVKISDQTLSQVANYNSTIRSPKVVVTNGLMHFTLETTDFVNYNYTDSIPSANVICD